MEQTLTYSSISLDFVEHLNPIVRKKLENLYGEYFPEIVDYEMKKIVSKKNEYLMRFGLTLDDLNDITRGGFFCYDPTSIGYIYGNSIYKTWEWANAVITDDKETMNRMLHNEALEEARYKAKFIEYYKEDLCKNPEDLIKFNPNKRLLAAHRRNRMSEINNIKNFMDDNDTWFMK